jgi:hypothetical protein
VKKVNSYSHQDYPQVFPICAKVKFYVCDLVLVYVAVCDGHSLVNITGNLVTGKWSYRQGPH